MFDNYRFVLASGSPRRQELIKGLDINFTIELNSSCDEVINDKIAKEATPLYLSFQKSQAFQRDLEEDEILITADTLVFAPKEGGSVDDLEQCEILGKPKDRDDAFLMLKTLSGKTHTVLTGVTLRSKSYISGFTSRTDVTFKQLSNSEIEYYLDNYQPYDKAGSYGAQEWIGYIAISSISGSYFNVMGLPVHKLYNQIQRLVSSLSNSIK